MLVKQLLGQINLPPENKDGCSYEIVDDQGNYILINKYKERTIFGLDRSTKKYKKLDLNCPLSTYPKCVLLLNNNNLILILSNGSLWHFDLFSQLITKLNLMLSLNKIIDIYGLQIYEVYQFGIRVIDFANYPDCIEFNIFNDKEDFRILKYSNANVLELNDQGGEQEFYQLPISTNNLQPTQIVKKQQFRIQSANPNYYRIQSFRFGYNQELSYQVANSNQSSNHLIIDKIFQVFVYHDRDQYNQSLVLQLRPKNKVLRKLLRDQLTSSFQSQMVINNKFILGNFDNISYSIYNVTNGQKTKQAVSQLCMKNGMLLNYAGTFINVSRVAVEEHDVQE